MKILAIDSSGLVASVAIATETTLLAEYTINYKKTHSQTLLPMIDTIVSMLEMQLEEFDAIAITAGPGSFTGLRIGSATAKGLAMVLQKPIIAIPTVEALAWNVYGTTSLICPLMDAKRSQVYTGLFACPKKETSSTIADSVTTQELITLIEQKAVAIEEIIEEINSIGKEVVYLGDGVDAYKEKICALTKVPYAFAPAHLCKQRAGSLAACAVPYFYAGKTQTASEHEPIYLRLSQAERERAEKLKEYK